MHPIIWFRRAGVKAKVLVILGLLALLPVLFALFLFIVSYVRWERERADLLTNVEEYHRFILAAEQGREKVTMHGRAGRAPTRIYDRNGALIGEFFAEQKEVVPNSHIPKLLKKAVIAMEDTKFYSHNGINLARTLKAAYQNIFERRTVGGSTITQQLAKLLFTNREQTLQRKLFELFGAKELESRYSKDDILLMYLNTVYLGHGVYGVEGASRLYFNKPVRMLDVYESALLAGLLSRPESFSPLKDLDAAKYKHLVTLARMVEIYPNEISRSVLGEGFERFWIEQEKKLTSPSMSFWKMRVNEAPYFIEYVRQTLQEYYSDDTIISGGLKVYTSVDLQMQKSAQQAMQNGLRIVESEKEKEIRAWLFKNQQDQDARLKKAKPEDHPLLEAEWERRRKAYLDEYSKPIEGALVSMDAETGYVLSMVGGRNFTFDNELNRAVYAQRQFGSSMKPLVYAVAIERDAVTAASRISDERRVYNDHGRRWSPRNYGYQQFGVVTIRSALIRSINTVAVETIAQVGPRNVAAVLEKIFFNQRGFPAILSLPLGSVEISPLDGARIYSALASGGYRVKPLVLRRILGPDDAVLHDFETGMVVRPRVRTESEEGPRLPDTLRFDDDNPVQKTGAGLVVDPRAAYIATDMMRGVLAPGGTGYYARVSSNFWLNAAGKSGTSDNNRDAWFCGYVRNHVAVVWVGYDNDKTALPRSMTGGLAAGPIWAEYMRRATWNVGPYTFPKPAGVVSRNVCRATGKLASEQCGDTYQEYFIDGTEPEVCTHDHRGDGEGGEGDPQGGVSVRMQTNIPPVQTGDDELKPLIEIIDED